MAETRAPPMARGADRISDLPEGVLHHILSLLPARDAVRTCVLAQSWRNHWRSAPALRFACSTGLAGEAGAFGRFVDGLLRARRGAPPLDTCDFDLDVDLDSSVFDVELHGNEWIRRVLKLNVRELRFRVSANPEHPFTLYVYYLSGSNLTSLELTGVHVDDDLHFSGCPVLESLKMEACHVDSAELGSASVKHLSIKKCFFDPEDHTLMWFGNLVSFQFITNFGRAPKLVERMPYLEAAKFQFDHVCDDRCKYGRLDGCGDAACGGCMNYYSGGDPGSVFLHGLAAATYLHLSAYPDMFVFYRDLKWCPAFRKLKTLVLSKWFLTTDLSALIWFLHHTPLLEKLTLEIPKVHKSLMETDGSYNPLENSIAPSHLQIVEIICKDVDGIVLKVLKALKANGIPLGKIRIRCSGYNFVCTDINSN